MARSYRTDPTHVIAQRRIAESRTTLRILEISPPQGDIHPLNKKLLRRIIKDIPQDYIYGLKAIELRPRTGKLIGRPYGEYLNDEKKIRIYSAPFPIWQFPGNDRKLLLVEHGAEVTINENETLVKWLTPVDLAYFIYREILLHELGHHYHNQYRTKRPHPETPAAEESSADRHMRVLTEFPAFQKYYDS